MYSGMPMPVADLRLNASQPFPRPRGSVLRQLLLLFCKQVLSDSDEEFVQSTLNCILLLFSTLQWFLARWWTWKALSPAAMPLAAAMLSNAVCSNSIGRSNAGLPADAMYNAQCGNAHAEFHLKLPFRNTSGGKFSFATAF